MNFEKVTTFDLQFDQYFEVEVIFDRVNLIERDGTVSSYKGIELRNQLFEYTSKGLVLEFVTDYSIATFYGFKADVEIIQTFDTLGYYLNGEKEQYIEVYGEYIEHFITIVGEDAENAYYTINSQLDTNQLGEQYVYYTIYNHDNEVVDVIRRTVIVYDNEIPIVTIVGDKTVYVEYGEEYLEQGATFTDNGPVSNPIEIVTDLNLDKIGTYVLSYVLYDDAGNVNELTTRTVVVMDTQFPEASLLPGIDTVVVGDSWEDAGVLALDNYDSETDVLLLYWDDDYVNTVGTRKVTYMVSDSSGNAIFIDRYITIVEPEYNILEVECLEFVSTIVIDGEIPRLDCDEGQVTNVDVSDVDVRHAGAYVLFVDITINDVEYTFRSYVFVIDRINYDNSLYYYDKKRKVNI